MMVRATRELKDAFDNDHALIVTLPEKQVVITRQQIAEFFKHPKEKIKLSACIKYGYPRATKIEIQ
jgi:hypothetical protein